MVDIMALRTEVAFIVNKLAKAVLSEFFTVAENISLNAQHPDPGAVDSLCEDAVNQILNIISQTDVKQDDTVGHLQAPPPYNDTCEGLTETQTAEGKDGTLWSPPNENTYILVYQSSAVDSEGLLVSLRSNADNANDANTAEGGNNSSSSHVTGEVTTLTSSLAPPPQADHEYARTSSPPPSPITAGEGEVRRDRCTQSERETAETHLKCLRCSMLFPNAERLADHQKKSHLACSVCRASFTGILKLREHQIKDHGLLPYVCDFCQKMFSHKAHRDLHVKARHTGEKSCCCDICGKAYASVSVLKTHRVTHFDKTFICDVCGRGFHHACHLTRHKLVHQDQRPYRCPTCGRGFTQAENLRSHQATHSGDKQLCSICGKRFRCLKNHVISKHLHELPNSELPPAHAIISCDVCGKKFPNPSQYRAHRRSHSGEKPFHCDICGKSYRLKELLRNHRYTHTGQKPYRCSLCSKSFNVAASFLRHRSIHTGETPYSCHDCGKHFRLLTFLKTHLQTKAHLKQTQQRQETITHL
ncbi:uncharacterized protein FYW49_008909 [Xenentodon cancila]